MLSSAASAGSCPQELPGTLPGKQLLKGKPLFQEGTVHFTRVPSVLPKWTVPPRGTVRFTLFQTVPPGVKWTVPPRGTVHFVKTDGTPAKRTVPPQNGRYPPLEAPGSLPEAFQKASRRLPRSSQELSTSSQTHPESSQKLPESSRKAFRRLQKLPEGSQKTPRWFPEAPRSSLKGLSERLSEGFQKAPRGSQKAPRSSQKALRRLPDGSQRLPEGSQRQDFAQKGRFPVVSEEKFNSRPRGRQMAEICCQKAPGQDLDPSKRLPTRIWPKRAVSQWSQKGILIAGPKALKLPKFASKGSRPGFGPKGPFPKGPRREF